MKLKLDRVISVLTLAASLVAIILVLRRPTPVVVSGPAPVQTRADAGSRGTVPSEPSVEHSEASRAEPVSSFPSTQRDSSGTQASQPRSQNAPSSSGSKPETTLGADTVSAMLAKTLGGGGSGLGLDSQVGSGSPNIKDQQVTMEGDVLHGKFLTEIAGKDVWVTISGHMGEKDGYATFDPTEIKVGDMDVPVSLVNPMLQKKLAEERDRLKIPGNGGQQ
jgi:hypothetical protein